MSHFKSKTKMNVFTREKKVRKYLQCETENQLKRQATGALQHVVAVPSNWPSPYVLWWV